jgi:16S rRNA (guanine966-N2)-methyltransferase
MDRMRESVFAILGQLEGKRFLDLFSGSGILSLEALSRGASRADLVENDPAKKKTILENFSWVTDAWRLHLMKVEDFLQRTTDRWDLIFLDPPFAYPSKTKLLDQIYERQLLEPDGLILLHHPTDENLERDHQKLNLVDRRQYGGSTVLFLKIRPQSDESGERLT